MNTASTTTIRPLISASKPDADPRYGIYSPSTGLTIFATRTGAIVGADRLDIDARILEVPLLVS